MEERHQWLPVAVIAKRYRIAPRRLRAAIRRGEIEHSRPGSVDQKTGEIREGKIVRTTEAAVERWLRTQSLPPTPTAEQRAAVILSKMN